MRPKNFKVEENPLDILMLIRADVFMKTIASTQSLDSILKPNGGTILPEVNSLEFDGTIPGGYGLNNLGKINR